MAEGDGLLNRSGHEATACQRDTSENDQAALGVLLGALASEIAPVAPDLADLLTAWPALPEPVKAGIAAMVKAACGEPAASNAEGPGRIACPKGRKGGD